MAQDWRSCLTVHKGHEVACLELDHEDGARGLMDEFAVPKDRTNVHELYPETRRAHVECLNQSFDLLPGVFPAFQQRPQHPSTASFRLR